MSRTVKVCLRGCMSNVSPWLPPASWLMVAITRFAIGRSLRKSRTNRACAVRHERVGTDGLAGAWLGRSPLRG
ncbi:hypothetical protein DMB66_41550 [Actinoplanes sp. ATCC 53533]|nr:hypothetical protein DMB66_41550 [Actinoplanes sp. ATCC 53533]